MPRKPNAPANWPERFLAAYRKNGNVSRSSETAHVTRRTVQLHRHSDPEFAKDMDDAQEEAGDALEQEARRRAVEGTLRPVYQQGKEVGQIREYSDTLLIILLQAARPDKYRANTRVEHSGVAGGPVPVAIREVIIERPAAWPPTSPLQTTGE